MTFTHTCFTSGILQVATYSVVYYVEMEGNAMKYEERSEGAQHINEYLKAKSVDCSCNYRIQCEKEMQVR